MRPFVVMVDGAMVGMGLVGEESQGKLSKARSR